MALISKYLLISLLTVSSINGFFVPPTMKQRAMYQPSTAKVDDKRYTQQRGNTVTMMAQGTPMVPWQPPGSEYAQFVDIYSRLYRDRIMLIKEYIDQQAANNIISVLLYLKKEDPKKKITLYFNVPGAQLRPALAVYDVIQDMKQDCEISTLNLSLASGMGAMLCGAGTKGMRFAMPNSRFLLQRVGMDQPFQGQASDIGLEVQNMKTMNDKMEYELSKMTGKSIQEIQRDMKRDFYLSSDEAVMYGLVDHVLLPSGRRNTNMPKVKTDPWTGRKYIEEEKQVDLGNFEGAEEQRYQGGDSGSNGPRQQPSGPGGDDQYPPTK